MNLLELQCLDRDTSTADRFPAIDQQASERFQQSSYLVLRDISCFVSDGVLTLRGRLPSYYLKQVAQEIASRVEGIRHVVNRIEVLAPVGRNRTASPRSIRVIESNHAIPRREDAPYQSHDKQKEVATMLVLSRKLNETIVIDGGIRITVVGLRGNQVRLGIEAPDSVEILRQEICEGPAGTRNSLGRSWSVSRKHIPWATTVRSKVGRDDREIVGVSARSKNVAEG